MPNITYEWKVDFALLLSLIIAVIGVVKWILDNRSKAKERKIQAYEQVYEDARYIAQYPLLKRRLDSKHIQYESENPELQQAVRKYLDSHWMDTYWGTNKFIPSTMRTDTQRNLFMRKVMEEASNFRDKLFEYQFDIREADFSPVFYLDDADVKGRLDHILNTIGRNPSAFSDDIQKCWSMARFIEPHEVRHEYEKGLEICPHFFKYNPRDFDDPYLDIVNNITKEYGKAMANKVQLIKFNLQRLAWRLRHPREYLKIRGEIHRDR